MNGQHTIRLGLDLTAYANGLRRIGEAYIAAADQLLASTGDTTASERPSAAAPASLMEAGFLVLGSVDGGHWWITCGKQGTQVVHFPSQPHECTDHCRVQREEIQRRLSLGEPFRATGDGSLQLYVGCEPCLVDEVGDLFADWSGFIHDLTVGEPGGVAS